MADLVWYVPLRILPECYFLLTAVEGHQLVSMLKLYAYLTGVYGVSCTVTQTFTLSQFGLCNNSVTVMKDGLAALLSLSGVDGW
jgi:hypothetical protein